jgi:hypothetical protein
MTRRILTTVALIVVSLFATPSSEPGPPSTVPTLSGAPQSGADQAADLVVKSARDPLNGRGSPRHRSAGLRGFVLEGGAETADGGAPTSAADVTRSGTWAYADPSYGPLYLAIPEGPGWRVRVCGPAACLDRVSTDAGPDLFLQRAGRIGDLSAVDFEAVCGLSAAQRVIFGLCQGTSTLLRRPVRLPETDAAR